MPEFICTAILGLNGALETVSYLVADNVSCVSNSVVIALIVTLAAILHSPPIHPHQ